MRRVLILAGSAALAALPGCGDDEAGDADRFRLRTPPPVVAAEPIEEMRDATAADAERLRPVIRAWANAMRESRAEAAAELFRLPAIVFQGSIGDVEIGDRATLVAFHEALPCGARLVSVQPQGRFVVGTFRLADRPGSKCDAPGETARVGFVAKRRRFTEWWQAPDDPKVEPGPPARPQAAPASPELFGQ